MNALRGDAKSSVKVKEVSLFTLVIEPDNVVRLTANSRDLFVERRGRFVVTGVGFQLIGLGVRIVVGQIARCFD